MMMTGSMSIFHWLVLLILAAIYLIPTARILQRAGFSGWWVIIGLIPLANVIGLWVFAFIDWPISGARKSMQA
jgi:hypothetical protein